jgi:tripartite ATP-independent transporter DctM subunit
MLDMVWWLILVIFFSSLLIVFLTGTPIAFSFLLLDIIAMFLIMGPSFAGSFVGSILDSLTRFTLVAVPLFVLMGEVLFQSGLAMKALDVLEKWLGKLPGRLSLLSIVSGALFASLSGSVMANTAMLGSLLTPEMRKKKYHKSMIVGPIVASGSLAMMIPPSSLTVIFGSLASVSVGDLLIAGILPGLLMAALYISYVIIACKLNPNLAPMDEVGEFNLKDTIKETIRDVLPLAIIVFLTVGVIFFGVATPTEAASLGAFGSVILAYLLGNFNLEVIKKSVSGAVKVTAMVLIIVAASNAFSQVLAFTGSTRHLTNAVINMPFEPFWILVGMLAVIFLLGMFIEQVAIMMITIPVFMPIIKVLGFDPVWFGILMLMMLQIALLTPPVGLLLYTIKGVTPDDITMQDIWYAATPYVFCGLFAIGIVLFFPKIATILII